MSRSLDWLRRLLGRTVRPVGPVGPLRPVDGPGGPVRPIDPPVDPADLQADKLRAQVATIRHAWDGVVGVATATGDDADVEYLFHPERILVRAEALEEVLSTLEARDYPTPGDPVEVLRGLVVLPLHPDTHDGAPDAVLRTLDDLDDALRQGLATPDHLLYVTPRNSGDLCPAGEPRVPAAREPFPRPTGDGAGKGTRVTVVDTGWHPPAAKHGLTPWLAGVTGDVEKIDEQAIHEYAGHGTFAAGVVRCQAPGADVRIEGFLRKGGAAYESEIIKELDDALRDPKRRPQVLSLSAGTHSRKDQGLLSLEKLADKHGLDGPECDVLVVAAAGNGATDKPSSPPRSPGSSESGRSTATAPCRTSPTWVRPPTSTRWAPTTSTRSRRVTTPAPSRRARPGRCGSSTAWPSGAVRRSPPRSWPGSWPRGSRPAPRTRDRPSSSSSSSRPRCRTRGPAPSPRSGGR